MKFVNYLPNCKILTEALFDTFLQHVYFFGKDYIIKCDELTNYINNMVDSTTLFSYTILSNEIDYCISRYGNNRVVNVLTPIVGFFIEFAGLKKATKRNIIDLQTHVGMHELLISCTTKRGLTTFKYLIQPKLIINF